MDLTAVAQHLIDQADIHDTAAQHAWLRGDQPQANANAAARQVYDDAAAKLLAIAALPAR